MNFNNLIVNKPWGYEYLLYQNDKVGIWYLYLKHLAQTSLHAHPNKKTGLIVLSGQAKVSFMNGHHNLSPCDKIMIRNGVFHSTTALSLEGLELIEVETPNNKEDIVRLEDNYGREGQPYEGSEHYTQGNQIILEKITKIGNCILAQIPIQKKEQLLQLNEKSKLIILEGMIFYNNFCICGPGDVLDNITLNRFANKFDCTPMSILEIKPEN